MGGKGWGQAANGGMPPLAPLPWRRPWLVRPSGTHFGNDLRDPDLSIASFGRLYLRRIHVSAAYTILGAPRALRHCAIMRY